LQQLTWAERIKGEKSDPFFLFCSKLRDTREDFSATFKRRGAAVLGCETVSLFAVFFFVQQRGEVLLVLQKTAASMSCCNKTENREEKRRKNSWFILLNWEEKPEKERTREFLACWNWENKKEGEDMREGKGCTSQNIAAWMVRIVWIRNHPTAGVNTGGLWAVSWIITEERMSSFT
jgi:hypothetical protein